MTILPTVPIEIMNSFQDTCENLFGPLNEVEKKYAPDTLYCAGDRLLFRECPGIAVIGSRKVSDEGAVLAADVSRMVVNHGGLVVSGLATGVDGISHRAAIETGGKTIAVIGTPLDRVYPKSHFQLQAEIMSHHLVVSQFPSPQPVQPRNFVLRNRTMALISHGSIIVEAGEKSGTEHQGWEAIRLGRMLFLPRALLNAPFEWPKKLVGYGALVFDDLNDLHVMLDEFLPSLKGTEDLREITF